MKFTIIALPLVALVAVVFSAPTNSNPNGQFHESGPSFGNSNNVGGWNNNGQGQRAGQLDNIKLQGFFQFYGVGELQQPSQSGNNQQFPGDQQGGNKGPSFGNQGQPGQGFENQGGNKPGEHGFQPNGFHFGTGQPFTGIPGHFGGMTGQPGFFGGGNSGNGNRRSPPSRSSSTTTAASG